MKFKYRHVNGEGSIHSGGTLEKLKAAPFCAQAFGVLERELLPDEQINPFNGTIEPRVKTKEEQDLEAAQGVIKTMKVLAKMRRLSEVEKEKILFAILEII